MPADYFGILKATLLGYEATFEEITGVTAMLSELSDVKR